MNDIEKGKKYLTGGMVAPKGVKVYTGAKGGKYYLSEELHAARGTTPQKRLPYFRHDGEHLSHKVKGGSHGPGKYVIHHDNRGYHLSHHHENGTITHLHTSTHSNALHAMKELKGHVQGYKEGKKPKEPAPEKPRRTYVMPTPNMAHVRSLASNRGHSDAPINQEERSALHSYKVTGFIQINNSLFGRSKSTPDVEMRIKHLDNLISKCKIDQGISYSGLGKSGSQMISSLNPGDSFEYAGFLSSTTNPDKAKSFVSNTANYPETPRHHILVIHHRRGESAYFSGNSEGESEVINPRGLKFKIDSIEEKDEGDSVTVYYHVSKINSSPGV